MQSLMATWAIDVFRPWQHDGGKNVHRASQPSAHTNHIFMKVKKDYLKKLFVVTARS